MNGSRKRKGYQIGNKKWNEMEYRSLTNRAWGGKVMRRLNCIFTAIKSIKKFRRENYLVGLSTSLQRWCNMGDIKTKTPLIQSFFINIGAPIAGIFADHPNILGVCFRHSVPIHRVLNSVLSTISSLCLFNSLIPPADCSWPPLKFQRELWTSPEDIYQKWKSYLTTFKLLQNFPEDCVRVELSMQHAIRAKLFFSQKWNLFWKHPIKVMMIPSYIWSHYFFALRGVIKGLNSLTTPLFLYVHPYSSAKCRLPYFLSFEKIRE